MSDVVHVIRATVDPSAAPTREGQHWVNTSTNITWLSVGVSSVADWVLVNDSNKVKASSLDTTAGFLDSKLSAGAGIVLTTLNPGANESIEISSPGSTTDEKVKVSATDTTAGYLNTELTVSNGTNATNPLEKSITSPSGDEKLNLQFDQTKLSLTASQVSDFNEAAQDAVGGALSDSASVDFTYSDVGNSITAAVIPGGVNHNLLLNGGGNTHIDHSTVSIIAGTGLSGGGDITASRTLNLANTAVIASSYGSATQVPTYTVDAQGRLTAAANVSIQITESQVTNLTTDLLAKADKVTTITAGTGLSGGGDLSTNRTLSIAATGVTAGSYGSATQVGTFTVNAQGQLTLAGSATIAIPSTQITDWNEAVDDRVAALLVAGTGISITYNDPLNTLTIAATTAGTVSSVALAMPSIFTVSGSPVTSSGTLTATLNTQAANLVFAGPTTGAAAIPTFRSLVVADIPALSYVTSVATGAGLTGGPITSSGTISFATIATGNILANISGGTAVPTANTLTAIIDNVMSNTQGAILYRNATSWVALSPGTAGQVLGTGGAAANPSWISNTVGSVTSVALSLPSIFTVSGSPVTSSGTLTGTLNTQAANLVFAGPTTGVAAVPTFRSLVAADIPALSYVTSVATGTGLTGGPITGSGTIAIANTSVTASSYGSATQVATFTVNAQGQLTAAANVAIAVPSTQITDFTEAAQDAVGGALVDSTSIDFTYNDAANQITAVVLPGGVNHNLLLNGGGNTHIDHSTVSITAGAGLTGGGDITASRTIAMPNVGTAGTYGDATHYPIITTDAQGRITSVTTQLTDSIWIDSGGLLTWSDETGKDLNIRQAGATGSAYIRQVSSNGTLASPTATTSGQRLGGNGMYGWNSTGQDGLPSGAMNVYATENHTATANGGEMRIELIPDGSTTPVTTATFENNGDLVIAGGVRVGNTSDTVDGYLRLSSSEMQVRQGGVWYIIAPNVTYLNATAAVTTTSATFATVGSMTTTPAAGTYKLDFTCAAALSTVSTGDFSVFIAGVEQAQCRRTIGHGDSTTSANSIAISTIITVNGSQVVDIRFRENASATLTANAREMILTPISR